MNDFQKKSGFSLLEIIIVIAIIAIIIPSIIALLLVNVRSHNQVRIIQQVKSNGDFALDKIETEIRNNVWAIYDDVIAGNEVCTIKSSILTNNTSSGPIYFRNEDNEIFYFTTNNGVMEYHFNGESIDLTNDMVYVDSFSIGCSRTDIFSDPVVSVGFVIRQLQGTRAEDKASMYYRTKFKIR